MTYISFVFYLIQGHSTNMPENDKKEQKYNPNGTKQGSGSQPKKTKEGCAPGYKTPGYVPTGNPRGRPKKTE